MASALHSGPSRDPRSRPRTSPLPPSFIFIRSIILWPAQTISIKIALYNIRHATASVCEKQKSRAKDVQHYHSRTPVACVPIAYYQHIIIISWKTRCSVAWNYRKGRKSRTHTNTIAPLVRARAVCIISGGPVRVLYIYENINTCIHTYKYYILYSTSLSPYLSLYACVSFARTRLLHDAAVRVEITAKLQRVPIKTLPACVLIVAYRVISVIASRTCCIHISYTR